MFHRLTNIFFSGGHGILEYARDHRAGLHQDGLMMEVIESSKAFIEHIEHSSDYNNDDLKKVKMWIKINEL